MKENTPNKTPIITLEVIAQRKAEKLEEVQQAKKEMVQTIHELFAPVEHKGGVEGIMQHINTGIAVYDGVRTGIKIMQRIRGYFLKNSQVEHRAIVCFRYLCEKVLNLDSEGICRTFTKTYGIKTLSKYKLKMLVDIVYESLFHLMNAAYPELSGKLENYRFDKRRHEKEGKSDDAD